MLLELPLLQVREQVTIALDRCAGPLGEGHDGSLPSVIAAGYGEQVAELQHGRLRVRWLHR